jgi:hypothetical protein
LQARLAQAELIIDVQKNEPRRMRHSTR